MSLFCLERCEGQCVGDEVSDGVKIERREFLQVSLCALSALTTRRAFAQPTARSLSWDDLLATTTSLAERLIANSEPDEETYLTQLSAMIERTTGVPRALFDLSQPVATAESQRRFPIWIVQFRLAPGAAIPYHDHRDYIGVLTVTDGSLRVRSFDIEGTEPRPPQGRTFQIRQTDDTFLTTGAQSTLSRTRGNIHDLRAGPEGAKLLDFFTLFEQRAGSFYLNVAEHPRDAARQVFDANWA